MKRDLLYEKVLKKFGIFRQEDKLLEEMSELQKEILKYRYSKDKEKLDQRIINIIDEIADVEIMIEQIKLFMNIQERVKRRKKFKKIRLMKFIE